MRKTVLIFTLLIVNISVFAQITIHQSAIKHAPVLKPVPFDSLTNCKLKTNFSVTSYKSEEELLYAAKKEFSPIVGQHIFFIPITKKHANQEGIWKSQDEKDYGKWSGKYYRVEELKYNYKNDPVFDYTLRSITFTLKEKEDSILTKWTMNMPSSLTYNLDGFYHIIIVGFYEKMKALYENKPFIITYKNPTRFDIPKFKDINTGESFSIKSGSILNCKALEFIESDQTYLALKALMCDNKGHEFFVDYNEISEYEEGYADRTFTLKSTYDENRSRTIAQATANKEKEKRLLTERTAKFKAKYGDLKGVQIAKGYVEIGMTKEMCRDSWGSPYDVNNTIVAGNHHEQWVYSRGNYLYFDNGILTGIQN